MSYSVNSIPRKQLTPVDDSSGATIELVLSDGALREMMPKLDDEEAKVKYWKRNRKPNSLEVGDLVKVKGELRERWNIRRIHVMKLGI